MRLQITRGDEYTGSRSLVVTVTDAAGAAVDLTGTSARFMAKRNRADADADAVISKSTGSGITLASPQTGATKGVAYIAIAAGDTDELEARPYYCELEATDSVGVITLATGALVIEPDLILGG